MDLSKTIIRIIAGLFLISVVHSFNNVSDENALTINIKTNISAARIKQYTNITTTATYDNVSIESPSSKEPIPYLREPNTSGMLSLPRFFPDGSCPIRYQSLRNFKTNHSSSIFCERVRKFNSICRNNLSVGYENLPPYLFKFGEQYKGILPELLKVVLDTCCLGCYELRYKEIKSIDEILIQNGTLSYDIIMPIKNKQGASTYNSHGYAQMLKVNNIKVYQQKIQIHPDVLLQILIKGTIETWPLFLLALVMAFCAGTIVWLLDTWSNKEHFPRKFPWGVLQGFWWAYVSMTTVGYGDLTPKSFPARMVAVVWILVGIAVFNMYTATLTSIITATIAFSSEADSSTKVGFLKETAVKSVIIENQWTGKGFSNIRDMITAFDLDEIQKLAFEEHTTFYYSRSIYPLDESFLVNKKSNFLQCGMGLVSDNNSILKLVQGFIDANEDLIGEIITDVGPEQREFRISNRKDKDIFSMLFTGESRVFYTTAGATIIVAILCVIIGTFMDQAEKKKERLEYRESSRELLSNKDTYTKSMQA